MAEYEKDHGITPEMLSGGVAWPTPNICGNHNRKGASANSGDGLSTAVKKESWATPNTLDHLACRTPEGVLKQATEARKGRSRPANLREQVDPATVEIYKEAKWTTPQARDFRTGGADRFGAEGRTNNLNDHVAKEASWPTPNMPSGGPLKDGSAIVGMNGGPGHREVIKKHFGAGAKLNPDWVCTLMGIQVGWVSVNDEGKNRIDELRLLGNGVVPQTAEKAFCHLTQEMKQNNVQEIREQ